MIRLINTKTLQLSEVKYTRGLEPRYAILSHTWGEDEVSFAEWACAFPSPENSQFMIWTALHDVIGAQIQEKIKEKRGYHKIREAAEIALNDGYDYLWADTCCIDKTSSAELSESINSMFRWYSSADKCYAYLEDVDRSSSNYLHQFSTSRWFTRGWTLQELIAPKRVRFSDRAWAEIGMRESMSDLLFKITGIPVGILNRSGLLSTSCVAQKISWVSTRSVSREEDIAYCLIGILGVHMPLLYGEGGFNAFKRLQLHILQTTTDNSIYAWTMDSSSPRYGLMARSPLEYSKSGQIRRYPSTLPYLQQMWRSSSNSINDIIRLQTMIRPALGHHQASNLFEILLTCCNGQADAPITLLLRESKIGLLTRATDAWTEWKEVGTSDGPTFEEFVKTFEHKEVSVRV